METLLVGLYPPSNVERTLNEAKHDLFTTFASVSAIALGPVIPLLYDPSSIEPPQARTLPHGMALSTGVWTLVEGTLMLSVEPADRLTQLSRALGGETKQGTPGTRPVAIFPGIYIACSTEAERHSHWPAADLVEPYDGNNMLSRLGPPPRIAWSTSDVVCWRIGLSAPHRWWDDVKCEELWRVRLRKGAAPTS